jgi:hypothetical protein
VIYANIRTKKTVNGGKWVENKTKNFEKKMENTPAIARV